MVVDVVVVVVTIDELCPVAVEDLFEDLFSLTAPVEDLFSLTAAVEDLGEDLFALTAAVENLVEVFIEDLFSLTVAVEDLVEHLARNFEPGFGPGFFRIEPLTL